MKKEHPILTATIGVLMLAILFAMIPLRVSGFYPRHPNLWTVHSIVLVLLVAIALAVAVREIVAKVANEPHKWKVRALMRRTFSHLKWKN